MVLICVVGKRRIKLVRERGGRRPRRRSLQSSPRPGARSLPEFRRSSTCGGKRCLRKDAPFQTRSFSCRRSPCSRLRAHPSVRMTPWRGGCAIHGADWQTLVSQDQVTHRSPFDGRRNRALPLSIWRSFASDRCEAVCGGCLTQRRQSHEASRFELVLCWQQGHQC